MSEYKWQRRDKRKESERTRMPKHGRELGDVYKNATLKRVKKKKRKNA